MDLIRTAAPRLSLIAACLALLSIVPARAQFTRPPIRVVAAENFYGDVAGQIGGPDVLVTSVLSNPDQDPHLFEASPSIARALFDRADRGLQRY